MKKTLLSIFATTVFCVSNAQVVFTSSFESWTANDPDGWLNSGATSFNTDSVIQVSTGTMYGSNAAQLVSASTSHKRLVTNSVSITNLQSYQIEYWAKGQGDIRAGIWDGGSGVSAYLYAGYNSINTSTWTHYTQTLMADSTSATGGFILSVRSSVAGNGHVMVDSFAVTAVATTNYSIYSIQYTTAGTGDSPLNGQTVSTGGRVTAVDVTGSSSNQGYWVQSGTGPWSGVFVFDATSLAQVAVGDSVTMNAQVTEYFNLTELTNISNFVKVSSGNTITPTVISTQSANLEDYEGVLVKVTNANCTAGNGTGNQWVVNDGTGAVFVDDQMYAYTASVGSIYDVTGPAHYSFSERKIEPRFAADVVVSTGLNEGALSSKSLTVWPNPSNGMFTVKNLEQNSTLEVIDLTGKTIYSAGNNLSGDVVVNLSAVKIANGIYMLRVTNAGVAATSKIVINRN